MKWKQLVLTFTATICLLFAGNALAQTDVNINNTNLIHFGSSVIVPENQVVENAISFGGNVTVSPNAKVVDTAIAFGGDVLLQKGARVEGDVYSFGGRIVKEPGAIINGTSEIFDNGQIIRNGSGMMDNRGRHRNSFFVNYFFSIIFRICTGFVAGILGLILLQARPQFIPNLATKLRQNTGLAALWGIGTIVSFVFATVFLAITLIGIPLIPLLILTTVIMALVGSLGVALFIGQSLIRNRNWPLRQQFLVGLVMMTVLSLIPYFGGLVVFLINLFGLGIIVLSRFGMGKAKVAPE
jgi:hypothetical protein